MASFFVKLRFKYASLMQGGQFMMNEFGGIFPTMAQKMQHLFAESIFNCLLHLNVQYVQTDSQNGLLCASTNDH